VKTFVIGWAKLRIRWGKLHVRNGKPSRLRLGNIFDETGFVADSVIGMPGVCGFRLLPGGKSLIVIDNRGDVTLRRIELDGSQVSLPAVVSVKYDQRIIVGPNWSKLLTAMSPCPILVHRQRSK
jgi:hypothetical protein